MAGGAIGPKFRAKQKDQRTDLSLFKNEAEFFTLHGHASSSDGWGGIPGRL